MKEEERHECLIHDDLLKKYLLLHSDVLIIDEVSMLHKKILENIDKKLRTLMGNENLLFGGKKVIFAGDFRQVLPIIKYASSVEVVNNSFLRSYLFNENSMKKYELVKNYRSKCKEY